MSDILVTWPRPLKQGLFIERLHRFAAMCLVNGAEVLVHVPATGRMRELLLEGVEVGLLPAAGEGRKTAWTLTLVRHGGFWVHVDSSGPTRVIPALVRHGLLPDLAGYLTLSAEPRIPHADEDGAPQGRFDFLLTHPERPPLWVEAKSVTLVREGVALFPDAPTPRGARHLRELARLRRLGQGAAALFVVQREDAVEVRPNCATDPDFCLALREAEEAGVLLLGAATQAAWDGLRLARLLPVRTLPC